jgi:acetyl esterase/lipase
MFNPITKKVQNLFSKKRRGLPLPKRRWFAFLPILLSGTMLAGCSEEETSGAKTPPAAEQKPQAQADRKNLPMNQKPIVYETPDADQVNIEADIPYKKADNKELSFDLYTPKKKSDGKLPVVIFVHGDAPPANLKNPKNWGQYTSWGRAIAAAGMAAVTFDHRSTEDFAKLTEAASDVDDLISYVRGRANDFGLDKDRIAVWVCSAGGPVGLSTVLRDRPDYVKAVMAYYTLMDLQDQRKYIPESVSDETVRDFSPIHHLGKDPHKLPPMLVVKAGQDSSYINGPLDRFVSEAKAKNAPLTFLEHPNGPHAFDIVQEDDKTREIIQTTIEFAKKHLQ